MDEQFFVHKLGMKRKYISMEQATRQMLGEESGTFLSSGWDALDIVVCRGRKGKPERALFALSPFG
jgi:hypothetical protein